MVKNHEQTFVTTARIKASQALIVIEFLRQVKKVPQNQGQVIRLGIEELCGMIMDRWPELVPDLSEQEAVEELKKISLWTKRGETVLKSQRIKEEKKEAKKEKERFAGLVKGQKGAEEILQEFLSGKRAER